VSLQAYRALAPICDECGATLADGEQCPVCGERRDARPVTVGAA
jgi:rubrerythrin